MAQWCRDRLLAPAACRPNTNAPPGSGGAFVLLGLATRTLGLVRLATIGSKQVITIGHKRKRPTSLEVGRLACRALAMTYFLTGNPQYHRRGVVSRSCSGWEGVGPTRYGRQEFWNSKVALTELCIASCMSLGTRTHLATRKVIESSRTGN